MTTLWGAFLEHAQICNTFATKKHMTERMAPHMKLIRLLYRILKITHQKHTLAHTPAHTCTYPYVQGHVNIC